MTHAPYRRPRARALGLSLLAAGLLLTSGASWAQATYSLTDLGSLGGSERDHRGTAMNASGQVAGYSTAGPYIANVHAALWTGTTLVDLGTLGGSQSWGFAINASGQVTGYSYLTDETMQHAFLWDGSAMLDLGTLGGTFSSGQAINASGQVTGYSYLTDESTLHAFLWSGSTMLDLGTLGGTQSFGWAINESGQVTGNSVTGDGAPHAFLWSGSTMLDLGTLGGTQSFGRAINASGQVTGESLLSGDAAQHAFLWNGSTTLDLGTIGGTRSQGNAINTAGQVAGWSTTAGGEYRAFLWDGSAMKDLGTLGGTFSSSTAINAAGQVTGAATTSGASQHAFLWSGTTMRDLHDLIDSSDPLKPYVTLFEGLSINDSGQILASGFDSRLEVYRAYLVSPMIANLVVTPVGSAVLIEPVVNLPDGTVSAVQLSFDSVVATGATSVTASNVPFDGAPESPAGFSVGDPPVYYDIDTTASFAGLVTLCFYWQEGQFDNENGIALFHFESGAWHDVTTTIDVGTNTVCGQVSSLSPFALFEGSPFAFSGFFPPVDNSPTRNIVKAGSAVPVKFALGGDKGLNIFGPGYPVSQALTCNAGTPSDAVETVTTSPTGLTYDAVTGQYHYVWKTEKSWAKTCRRLMLKLSDGSVHFADFELAK